MADEFTESRRPHLKRRKTLTDYIRSGGSLAGAIAAILVLMGGVTDKLPFVQKVPYANDQAAQDIRFQHLERRDQDFDEIKRNQLLTMQLGLQQRVDVLEQSVARTPMSDPNRGGLSATLRAERQRLDELNRVLSR